MARKSVKKVAATAIATATGTVLTDEQAATVANEVREKELAELNGGKLPEQTDADAEVRQAQESSETATTTEVELKGKPPMLTNEAEIERKKSQDEAHKASKNSGLRMNVAIGYPSIMAAFAGRSDNSVTLEEFIEYRENRLKELPEAGNYHRFSYEANGFVQKLFERTQKIVQTFFQGRYDVGLAEVKAKVIEIEKPAPLGMEAELVRQEDLENAKKVSDNELRRYGVAVGHRSIMEAFEKDADGSVTPERYRGFRDSRLSKLPADANYFKFAKDANYFIREQKLNLQKELQKAFAGCYDVQLEEVQDEILLIEAEASIRRDPRAKQGLKMDSDEHGPLVVVCVTDHDSPVRFVAMVWMERGQQTGHFFETTITNEVKAACVECREIGAANGVAFDPYLIATRKVKAAKSAGATFADAVKKPQQFGGGSQSPNGGRKVSDEEKRKASHDVEKFLGGVPGPYFFRHRDWEIHVPEGVYVSRDRQLKGADVFIESNGKEAVIIDRRNDFGKMVGKPFPIDEVPGRFWAFLSQVRNINRTD